MHDKMRLMVERVWNEVGVGKDSKLAGISCNKVVKKAKILITISQKHRDISFKT